MTDDALTIFDRDPGDGLAHTAALMRERANAASKGTWVTGGIGDYGWTVYANAPGWPSDTAGTLSIETDDSDLGRADAAHIASWNPTVALAVADWLEAEAAQFRSCAASGRPLPMSYRHAVEVAKAYLSSNIEET